MAIKSDVRVARRYAAALFEAASNAGGDAAVEAASNDLAVVEQMLADTPYLRAVLVQPLVTDDRKHKIVADAFESRLGPLTVGFLNLLIRKRREPLVNECISEFRRLADESAGRMDAFVESASPLTDDQLTRIGKALETRTGKTIRLQAAVDTEMLGGLRVRIGDSIIDAGLRTRLEGIRLRLGAAR